MFSSSYPTHGRAPRSHDQTHDFIISLTTKQSTIKLKIERRKKKMFRKCQTRVEFQIELSIDLNNNFIFNSSKRKWRLMLTQKFISSIEAFYFREYFEQKYQYDYVNIVQQMRVKESESLDVSRLSDKKVFFSICIRNELDPKKCAFVVPHSHFELFLLSLFLHVTLIAVRDALTKPHTTLSKGI